MSSLSDMVRQCVHQNFLRTLVPDKFKPTPEADHLRLQAHSWPHSSGLFLVSALETFATGFLFLTPFNLGRLSCFVRKLWFQIILSVLKRSYQAPFKGIRKPVQKKKEH